MVALALAIGCGGSTSGEVGSERSSSGGAAGSRDAGSSGGTAGAMGSGGSGAAKGSGGANSGGASNDTSPGTASVEFSVIGEYCEHGCGGQPYVGIKDGTGQDLVFDNFCYVDCATCQSTICPPLLCLPDVRVESARFDWDGHYYAKSTCGSGTVCLESTYAKPGKYTATLCVMPGTVSGPDGGFQQCLPTGPERCASIAFDFPSANTIQKGTLGP